MIETIVATFVITCILACTVWVLFADRDQRVQEAAMKDNMQRCYDIGRAEAEKKKLIAEVDDLLNNN